MRTPGGVPWFYIVDEDGPEEVVEIAAPSPAAMPRGPVDVAGPMGGREEARERARGWSAVIAAARFALIGFILGCLYLVEAATAGIR